MAQGFGRGLRFTVGKKALLTVEMPGRNLPVGELVFQAARCGWWAGRQQGLRVLSPSTTQRGEAWTWVGVVGATVVFCSLR